MSDDVGRPSTLVEHLDEQNYQLRTQLDNAHAKLAQMAAALDRCRTALQEASNNYLLSRASQECLGRWQTILDETALSHPDTARAGRLWAALMVEHERIATLIDEMGYGQTTRTRDEIVAALGPAHAAVEAERKP